MKATGALASSDLDFLLPYATQLVRSTASTSSSNCLAWSTRCRISMTRQRSLTAALTYLSKCSAKTACPLRGRQRHAAKPDLGRDRGYRRGQDVNGAQRYRQCEAPPRLLQCWGQ